MSRRSVTLDEQGFSELAAEMATFLERCGAIERDSAERLACTDGRADGKAPGLTASVVTMLFASPTPGVTATVNHGAPEAAGARAARAVKE